jgi:hypothetical protein
MTLDTTDLLKTEPEDSYDYMIQEHERRQEIIDKLPEILDEYIDTNNEWVIRKFYMFMYFRPNIEMHYNRVRGLIQMWLELTKYRALVEAKIITEDDIINNYSLPL